MSSAMSDDGHAAWYISYAARLVHLNLDTGEAQERIGRTPQLGSVSGVVPGSALSLRGVGLSDETFSAQSFPLPRSLGGGIVAIDGIDAPLISVSPTEITLQVPWETPSAPDGSREVNIEVKTASSSPFATKLTAIVSSRAAAPSVFTNTQYLTPQGSYGALAVHEGWDALVTPTNPARPNEVIHLYGVGFGLVDPTPATGLPAPSDPLAHTVVPVVCTTVGTGGQLQVPVLFSCLAPGLVGYYQLDIRIPASNLSFGAGFTLSCVGDGSFSASFPVKP